MTINKENYPEYILDFFEGRLSESDKAELFVFLDRHPALKEEFDAFEPMALEPGEINFPDRESLKRGRVTPSNYEWYFAAYVEGDLSSEEQEAVEQFALTNPHMGRELRMMEVARLAPDGAVTYASKADLKRHVLGATRVFNDEAGLAASTGGVGGTAASDGDTAKDFPPVTARKSLMVRHLWQYVSAAAVVLLIAGLFFMRSPEPEPAYIVYDVPAVEEVDKPEAVADVPSSAGITVERPAKLADTRSKISSKITETTASDSPSAASQIVERSADYRSIQPSGSTFLSDEMPSLKAIKAVQPVWLSLSDQEGRQHATMDYKTEFAYWRHDLLPDDYYTPEEYALLNQEESDNTNLTQLALSGLEQNLPIDFSKVDSHLNSGRIPLMELAGKGLTELGITASNLLGIERDVDEQGRTLAVRAGGVFEARRSRR